MSKEKELNQEWLKAQQAYKNIQAAFGGTNLTKCCNATDTWEDCTILDPATNLPHAECYKTVCTKCDKISWLDCEVQ